MSSVQFDYHTPQTAPNAKESFAKSHAVYGFHPTLHQVMAEAPASYAAYLWLMEQFQSHTSLSPLEQQIVFMTANYENHCHYCTAGHSFLMSMMKLPSAYIEGLREGLPLPDAKHEALRTFTRELIEHRGHIGDQRLQAFLDAGYGRKQALEVLVGLSAKLLSNFTNALAHTNLDAVSVPFVWTHPADRHAEVASA
jgi:alkylhydroperoxidase family enzyme